MKVIEVFKSYRNGNKTHYLVLPNEFSDTDIDIAAEEWCQSDSNGHNYGYNYDWNIILNESLIKDVLKNELKLINSKIKKLKTEKLKIEEHLNSKQL